MPWKLRTRLFAFLLTMNRVKFGGSPSFEGLPPEIDNCGQMSIGEWCLFRTVRLRPGLTTYEDATLTIGNHAYINDGVGICATKNISIGNHVKIGDMTTIIDSDFHQVSLDPMKQKPISIGNNVWVGSRSLILAGSSIGDHSVIAAGSVVTKHIPPKCVAAGVPARVIKTIDVPDNWIRA
jgi:acetyltransferase-like isoleucine patch superfamily enzyme